MVGVSDRPATFSSARAAWAPRGPPVSRSPQTITTSSPRARSNAGRSARISPASAPARLRSSCAPLPPSAASSAAERLAGARREAHGRPPRCDPATTAGSSHHERDPVAAHALADAQVDHRCVVDRLAVEHQHRVRELGSTTVACARGGAARPAGLRQRAALARVDVRGLERVAHQRLPAGSPPRSSSRRRRRRGRAALGPPARRRRRPARGPIPPGAARHPRGRAAA